MRRARANKEGGRHVFLERVASTMKGEGTETRFELLFTRTPGYLWALLFRRLGVHPTVVTVASILIGCAAGWFFGQTSVGCNIIGVCLLVWANWYDCADGQLARMTGKTSLTGRILDGFAGDLWFFSIYFFICMRLQAEWGVFVWLLAAWAGLYCHARQCASAYLPRAGLFRAQTPLAFSLETFRRAFASAGESGMQQAQSVFTQMAAQGVWPLHIVQGESRNFKITYPDDLELFRALLAAGQGW